MSRSFYRWAALVLFLIEVLIAWKVSGAEYPFIRYSIGDLLVVILLYCVVKSFFTIDAKWAALSVLSFAFAVEFAQYFHIVDVLGIQNQVLRIIIGTSYSVGDLLMYTLGVVAAYGVDYLLIRRVAEHGVS